ncbi:hypothetical protein D3C85_1208040 [compost metagenome]
MITGILLSAVWLTLGADDAVLPSARLAEVAPTAASLPNTTLTGYSVSARNRRAVRAAMNISRPTDRSGTRHDAYTAWNFQPTFMRRNGECVPESADLQYSITITLPDLETRDQLSRGDRAAWDRYFTALVSHEVNHARIVEEGAKRIKAAMRAANTCEAMQAAARAGMDEVSAASAQYDLQTRHGALEGATF